MSAVKTQADLERRLEDVRSLLEGVADAPMRYCKTHGVTTQFVQFPRCIQYEVDEERCVFAWVALVELGDE